jgi:hypothetical protein
MKKIAIGLTVLTTCFAYGMSRPQKFTGFELTRDISSLHKAACWYMVTPYSYGNYIGALWAFDGHKDYVYGRTVITSKEKATRLADKMLDTAEQLGYCGDF